MNWWIGFPIANNYGPPVIIGLGKEMRRHIIKI
jgi:hypothetical protein